MAAEPYYVIIAHGRHRMPELVCFEEDGPPGTFDTQEMALKVSGKLGQGQPKVEFTVIKLED